jgi:uncharacterized protein YjbI with pentapeptide repeats
VALVISNSAYANAADVLPGARRDGKTMQSALESVGFRVTPLQDATKAQMESAVRAFQRELRNAGPTGVGFFYYAGHGTADRRRQDNFLLPVDIESVSAPDIDSRGLGVRWITDLLRLGDPRSAIVVAIDACRSTSAARSRGSGVGTTAQMDLIAPDEITDRGFLVAYSTSKGQAASDAPDFADALARRLATRGLTLDQVFEQTRQEVADKTRVQVPAFRSSLVEKVCLAGCDEAPRANALATLKTAVAERATGDVGQADAIRQLTREGRSLSGFDLMGLHLKGGELDKTDFSAAEMQGVNLDEARLHGARLAQAQMAFATLKGARAAQADARETRMYFVDAAGADFSGLDAERSHWRAASLVGANFRGARLQGASFMLADLRDADFRGADLRGAFFIGAVVTGARFDQAMLANTDFTGAVGDASQFSPAQRAALCATENARARGFRVQLVKVTPSTRYASGKDFQDLRNEYALLGPGLSQLDRCQPRTLLPAGVTTVYKGAAHEEVAEAMTIALPAELLDRAGRQRQYLDRADSTLKMLNAASKAGPFIRVPGQHHQRLLVALQANVSKTKLQSTATLDGDAMTLYMLRFQPDSIAADDWAQMAGHWAQKEANGIEWIRRNLGNQWPLFFPPGTSASELAPEHVEVFRRWTLQRAREYPARVTMDHVHFGQLRHIVMNAGNSAAPEGPVARPIRVLIQERGVPKVSAAQQSPLDPASTYLGAANGGWGGGGAVIRLPRAADDYALRLRPQDVAAAQNDSLGLRMTLEVRGMHVMKGVKQALQILDAEIMGMELLDSSGQPIR